MKFVVLSALCAVVVSGCGDNNPPDDNAPTIDGARLTTAEDTAATLTLRASDPEGTALEITLEGPDHGTVTRSGETLTYTPAPDYHGPDAIRVTVNDGTLTAAATVSITVTPVNDAPVASADSLAAAEDTLATATIAALVANDSDLDGDTLTIIAVSAASNGTADLVGDTVTFTPAADFTGAASFDYTVSDGTDSDSGTVTVTVGAANDDPVAADDAATVAEDTAATLMAADLLGNDTDVEGQTLSLTAVAAASAGTVALAAGVVTYTPPADFNGTATFAYTVSDGAATDTAIVTVTVTAVNDAPVAAATTATTGEDLPVTIRLDGSDVDLAAGDLLTFTVATGPATGTLSAVTRVSATAVDITYTPAPDSIANDSFTFVVHDGSLDSSPASVLLNLSPDNDPPIANAVAPVTTAEDTAVVIAMTGLDVDGDALTFQITGQPGAGALSSVRSTGATSAEVTYTPSPDSIAADQLTFVVSDGTLSSPAVTVAIAVTPVNDAPVATAAAATTDEDTEVVVALAGTDIDGDALSFSVITGPAGGTVSAVRATGATTAEVTYTPGPDASGTDTFTFRASDGGASSALATATVTVTPVNDVPVVASFTVTTDEDTAVVITLTGTDVDSPGLTFHVDSGPTAGSLGPVTSTGDFTATVRYTPAADSTAGDSFTFHAADGTGPSPSATVTIAVVPVNDGPTADAGLTAGTDEDVAVSAIMTGLDPEQTPLGFAIVTPPIHGTLGAITVLTSTSARALYTPVANYHGPDSFTFTVTDASGATSAPATVAITVQPINDAPTATVAAATTAEDTAVTLTFAGADVDTGTTLTVVVDSGPAHGSLSSLTRQSSTGFTATYTPAANYNGPDAVSFHVNDGTANSAVVAVTIGVTAVNDGPTAFPGSSSFPEDNFANTLVSGTDPEGTTLTFTIVTPPSHGTLGTIVTLGPTVGFMPYTPAANYHGPDSYTFTVTDGDGAISAPATNTITVQPVNDAPVANPATVATSEDTTFTFQISGSDIDSSTLSLLFDTNPSHGTILDVARASATSYDVTYAPAPNYSGADSFTFHASDGSLSSPTATVTLSIAAVNDAPVATPGAVTTNEDSAVLITLVGADTDGDPLTFAIVTPPASGSLGAITPTSSFTASVLYTPPANAITDTSFTFRAHDGTAPSAAATVTIDVVPVNDPPSATADSATINPGPPVSLTLRGTDLDGDALTFAIVTGPTDGTLGTVTQATPGSATVVYTPVAGSVADDRFTFRVNDGAVTSAPVTFAVVITGTECGDGAIEEAEQCDDGDPVGGDGCSAACTVEAGFVCSGQPTTCATVCGDGTVAGAESCEDGNQINTDGCTNLCVAGPVCSSANPALSGIGVMTTDPATGHCFYLEGGSGESYQTASLGCGTRGAYLPTITSAGEQAIVDSLNGSSRVLWLRASDRADEGTFTWGTTGDDFVFTDFAPGQPDLSAAAPHCLHTQAGNVDSRWAAATCTTAASTVRMCELPLQTNTCGDGAIQTNLGEECDDGNAADGDGCSADCKAQIFISEYIEGSVDSSVGQMDAIELYNPSSSMVIMPGICVVQSYTNGATTRGNQMPLSMDQKIIEPHGTLSMCNNQATGTPLAALCPDSNVGQGVVHKSFWPFLVQVMTGNDVIVLRCNFDSAAPDTGGFLYDVVGTIGTNPGVAGWGAGDVTTANHTLRRKCGPVTRRSDPYAPFVAEDWDSFPVDTVDDIRQYNCP